MGQDDARRVSLGIIKVLLGVRKVLPCVLKVLIGVRKVLLCARKMFLSCYYVSGRCY